MTLHQDKELFWEAIEAAAGHFQLNRNKKNLSQVDP
jgi:hypothetical protein